MPRPEHLQMMWTFSHPPLPPPMTWLNLGNTMPDPLFWKLTPSVLLRLAPLLQLRVSYIRMIGTSDAQLYFLPNHTCLMFGLRIFAHRGQEFDIFILRFLCASILVIWAGAKCPENKGRNSINSRKHLGCHL